MQIYLDLLKDIQTNGEVRTDRTGTGTRSLFGRQLRFDLRAGFPLLTTKKVWFYGVVHELLWFLSGSTNIKYLQDHDVHIWDSWADKKGDLGPVYGQQWRSWRSPVSFVHKDNCVDQIKETIKLIKTTPDSRRIVVSAWNVGELSEMALAPCHCLFQFYVSNDSLDLQLYQRSADVFLGVPFNIASYALLLAMVAQVCDLKPRYFIHTFGDVHIYNNHDEAVAIQLSRTPKELPKLKLNSNIKSIFEFKAEDIIIENYEPLAAIKAPVAV